MVLRIVYMHGFYTQALFFPYLLFGTANTYEQYDNCQEKGPFTDINFYGIHCFGFKMFYKVFTTVITPISATGGKKVNKEYLDNLIKQPDI